MPTNILRKAATSRSTGTVAGGEASGEGPAPGRIAILTAGRVSLRLAFHDTATARLVWQALPLYSSAETWGAALQFETPLETGRDRTAKLLATIGDVYFWVERDRIVVPFGPTPISRPGEVRLQSPSNVIARTLDDPVPLAAVTPGEKVGLVRASS